ncbi:MAG: hypothetical protein ACPLTR_09575, partial [Thermacetogeniaceae bacterium]
IRNRKNGNIRKGNGNAAPFASMFLSPFTQANKDFIFFGMLIEAADQQDQDQEQEERQHQENKRETRILFCLYHFKHSSSPERLP